MYLIPRDEELCRSPSIRAAGLLIMRVGAAVPGNEIEVAVGLLDQLPMSRSSATQSKPETEDCIAEKGEISR